MSFNGSGPWREIAGGWRHYDGRTVMRGDSAWVASWPEFGVYGVAVTGDEAAAKAQCGALMLDGLRSRAADCEAAHMRADHAHVEAAERLAAARRAWSEVRRAAARVRDELRPAWHGVWYVSGYGFSLNQAEGATAEGAVRFMLEEQGILPDEADQFAFHGGVQFEARPLLRDPGDDDAWDAPPDDALGPPERVTVHCRPESTFDVTFEVRR